MFENSCKVCVSDKNIISNKPDVIVSASLLLYNNFLEASRVLIKLDQPPA
jgi:hypothetical protein